MGGGVGSPLLCRQRDHAIQPYICTYKGCLGHPKLITSFSFLAENEISEHTLESYRSRSNNEETSSQEKKCQGKSTT